MGWDGKGNAHCDTCDAVKEVNHDTQVLRAFGWHHSQGKTLGGKDYEGILCGTCARDERKRERRERGQLEGQLDIFGTEHTPSFATGGIVKPSKRTRFVGD